MTGWSKRDGETMSRAADPKAKITILRAAEEVFAERGVAGAKVEEIARRAGISKGAFYLHFESKDAALRQIADGFLSRCAAFFAGPEEYPDAPICADDLLDFCIERDVAIYQFLWENRNAMRTLTGCRGEPYDAMIDGFRAELERRTREWIGHWRREGLFREAVDAELAATLIGGAYHDLAMKLLRAETRPPLEEWLGFALETFSRAYGTDELLQALDRRERERDANDGLPRHGSPVPNA